MHDQKLARALRFAHDTIDTARVQLDRIEATGFDDAAAVEMEHLIASLDGLVESFAAFTSRLAGKPADDSGGVVLRIN